mgnify:CR=1 FL=1
MAKVKKKQDKGVASGRVAVQTMPAEGAASDQASAATEPASGATALTETTPERSPAAVSPSAPARQPLPPQSNLRRWMPDLIKAALALAVISIAAAIWYKPPLTLADFPYVSYQFQGETFTDAQLFRPLAMPTRYYIRLPKRLADRYEWFAVDRRREVAALTIAPRHRFLGREAIKRTDPLGLDLEFRKLDHSEWQVYFLADAIVFSNTVLTVRMDTKKHN